MSLVECQMKNVVLRRNAKFEVIVNNLTIPEPIGNEKEEHKLPLLGISGAGKTTLLNLMAGMEWPHEGTIRWRFPDNKIIEWGPKGLSAVHASQLRRRYFGYSFQSSTLIEHLNVRDNLCYQLMLKNKRRPCVKTAGKALETLFKTESGSSIEDILNRFPSTLSGGEKQRIALLQAMIHKPSVIFADEPTGSLDRKTRTEVMKTLYKWVDDPVHKGRRLLIWVTHHEMDPRDADVMKYICILNGIPEWKKLEVDF
jgi:ABC-type lipoprotein export system ATPase subunit